ncbi:hypothetical protein [Streptomyces sp. NPDC088554]|uniref:hypothetical protein n=1 Tax=Streptomyces sp. NPDC088554 TaxID=3365865 RepID=UPI003800EFE2
MLYLTTPSGAKVRAAMAAGLLGWMQTPAQGNILPPGQAWGADNGCFGRGYPGDEGYLSFLSAHGDRARDCLFATAPDVVGDAAKTMTRSLPFLPEIRRRGYPAALVAQNGLEALTVPWDDFDVLFIGGDTEWKLGEHARALTSEACRRGKWVHMGRVNSLKRLRYAQSIGCRSADGTYVAFGPDVNLPKCLEWVRRVNEEAPLWSAA